MGGKRQFIIIAGVHKAATTSLYSYLSKHPDINPSYKKETNFFGTNFNNNYINQNDYLKNFPSETHKFYLEADPSYIYGGKQMAQKIKSSLDEVRVIFIFREQIQKLVSNYKHQIKTLSINKDSTFDSFLKMHVSNSINTHYDANLISEGFYYTFLKDWYRVLSPDHIKVIFFDDIVSKPNEVVNSLYKWLSIDLKLLPNGGAYGKENISVTPKFVLFHKFAYLLYKKNEHFCRNSNSIQILKKLYFHINTQEFSDIVFDLQDNKDISDLKEGYSFENSKLKGLLKNYGYKDFPEWLK